MATFSKHLIVIFKFSYLIFDIESDSIRISIIHVFHHIKSCFRVVNVIVYVKIPTDFIKYNKN